MSLFCVTVLHIDSVDGFQMTRHCHSDKEEMETERTHPVTEIVVTDAKVGICKHSPDTNRLQCVSKKMLRFAKDDGSFVS